MLRPIQFIRLLKINYVMARYTLNRTVLTPKTRTLRLVSYLNPFSFAKQRHSRGEAIRIAFETLGPIFVKFGQLLSTRYNLLPDDVIQELSKLQDRVPPFPTQQAVQILQHTYQKQLSQVFAEFSQQPLASASIAQVHSAKLFDGSDVIVKILRPKINRIIRHDIAILYSVARLTERLWSHGKRLRLVELVAEFEQTILDELDLAREAANASHLRRNFANSNKMYVPKIHWDYVHPNVLVMERIYGTPISQVDELKARHTDLKKLAENGVEIFFTQVFRDSFFHADMHPGNLFVDIKDPANPIYIGVDFGIMGSLSPSDQHYLAANFLAFFNRDYRKIAELHIDSGWVPPSTRIEQFEAAIRTVCEPIAEKPLAEISFGKLLLRLFQTAERFHMRMQPQLMLLQKTLLSIESLGRQLYPQLDLWQTAQPYLEQWKKQRYSLKRLAQYVRSELPDNAFKLLETPPLLHDLLKEVNRQQLARRYNDGAPQSKLTRNKPTFFIATGCGLLLAFAANWLAHRGAPLSWPLLEWGLFAAAIVSLLIGWWRSKQ